jgi:glucosamine 6-phosphate synthetase-like amidotransferase/phosphosugar isomerase protein
MCGIVSIISKRQGGFWHADLELFEGLLILDTTRGLDSTGVFCVDSARQVGFMKVASHPFNLFAIQGYPNVA